MENPIRVKNTPGNAVYSYPYPCAIGILPTNAPIAFPRLKEICEQDAPSISPPLAFSINKTCCGAETANKHPVQIHIRVIAIKGFAEQKNIPISEIAANN